MLRDVTLRKALDEDGFFANLIKSDFELQSAQTMIMLSKVF